MRTARLGVWAVVVLLGAAAPAPAQVVINEVLFNPAGADGGQEFVELRSTAGSASLTGLTLLVIEGEAQAAGVVDQVIALDGFSTGANGLFLQRDAATVLNPAPNAATVVRVQDFTPDIENGPRRTCSSRG